MEREENFGAEESVCVNDIFLFYFIYFEREDREMVSRGGAEREEERGSQPGFVL